jgi:hypothetical protein
MFKHSMLVIQDKVGTYEGIGYVNALTQWNSTEFIKNMKEGRVTRMCVWLRGSFSHLHTEIIRTIFKCLRHVTSIVIGGDVSNENKALLAQKILANKTLKHIFLIDLGMDKWEYVALQRYKGLTITIRDRHLSRTAKDILMRHRNKMYVS